MGYDNEHIISMLFYEMKELISGCIQLFAGVFAEDPLFICEIAETFAMEEQEGEKPVRGQMKRKNKIMMGKVGRVMEVSQYT